MDAAAGGGFPRFFRAFEGRADPRRAMPPKLAVAALRPSGGGGQGRAEADASAFRLARAYAADAALAVLKGRGAGGAAVQAGPHMVVGDRPPGQAGWRVRVATDGR